MLQTLTKLMTIRKGLSGTLPSPLQIYALSFLSSQEWALGIIRIDNHSVHLGHSA